MVRKLLLLSLILPNIVRPFFGDAVMLCTYEIMFSLISLMEDLKNKN